MAKDCSPCADADSLLKNSSHCSCTDCNTAFCIAKRAYTNKCNKPLCSAFNTSVFYVGKEPHLNATEATDIIKTKTPHYVDKFVDIQVDSKEIISKIFSRHSYKSIPGVKDNVEDFNIAETDKKHAEALSTATIYSRKNMSTTTAQLSAQIMNVSYKDLKETLSHEKPEIVTYTTNDILKRIKEAYAACTCKICECLVGKPALAEVCNCEPCNCKDCANLKNKINKATTEIQLKKLQKDIKKSETVQIVSGKCDCNDPCDCIQCSDSNPNPNSCSCKPCECTDCKSMMAHRNKTIIVATEVGESTQRAACICAPCDCTRCRQRGINLSRNRVHEISTGINRHPNCRCDTCMNDACEPNGTDSCRCESRRGVISKPVDKNTNDYDIRIARVFNNRINTTTKTPARCNPISLHAALKKNPTLYRTQLNRRESSSITKIYSNKQECKCSTCECIVCECKENDFNNFSTLNYSDKHLRTLKPPSLESKACQCLSCECQFCSYKRQTLLAATMKFKNCSCKVCDCINCTGLSKLKSIPITIKSDKQTCSTYKCECRPCECNNCQRKYKIRDDEVCHCDICRCEHCADESYANDTFNRNETDVLTPFQLCDNPLSEPELLRKSSEYTHIKSSKGQSNVFRCESSAPDRSIQSLTIFHLKPENKFNRHSNRQVKPQQSVIERHITGVMKNKSGHNNNYIDLNDSSKDGKELTQFYCASISKSSSVSLKSEISAHQHTCDLLESIANSCLADVRRADSGSKSQSPPVLSISPSRHNLLNLEPSYLSYNTKNSFQPNISFQNVNVEVLKTLPAENSLTCKRSRSKILKKYSLIHCRYSICHWCGTFSNKVDSKMSTYNAVAQTTYPLKDDYNSLHDQFAKRLVTNHSDAKNDAELMDSNFRLMNNEKNRTWRLENYNPKLCSENAVDTYLTRDKASYDRALITLQKAKEFSSGLMKLFYKYERANLEFKSISKALKESHEKMLNGLYLGLNVGNVRKRSNKDLDEHVTLVKDYRSEQQKSEALFSSGTQTLIDTQILDDYFIGKELQQHYSYGLISKIKKNKAITAIITSSLRALYNISTENGTQTNDHDKGSNTQLLHLGESKVNKSINESDGAEIQENYYKIYKNLVKRSAYIAKKISEKYPGGVVPADELDALTADSKDIYTIEAEALQTILKEEIHTIFKELVDGSKESPSYKSIREALNKERDFSEVTKHRAEKTKDSQSCQMNSMNFINNPVKIPSKIKTKNVLPAVKREVKQDVKGSPQKSFGTEQGPSLYKNKSKEQQQQNVNYLYKVKTSNRKPKQEVKDLEQNSFQKNHSKDLKRPTIGSSTGAFRSSSVFRDSLFDTRGRTRSKTKSKEQQQQNVNSLYKDKTSNRKPKQEVKEEQKDFQKNIKTVDPDRPKNDDTQPNILARNSLSSPETAKVWKSKSDCNNLKVAFVGMRKVSNHTVMVKWKAPEIVENIKGYEILVDGRAVQKIFGPSRCMAVLTCLPPNRKVLLTIRTVTKTPSESSHCPCSNVVYQPSPR